MQGRNHISKICANAGQKLTAILRIVNLMSLEKHWVLVKSFFRITV